MSGDVTWGFKQFVKDVSTRLDDKDEVAGILEKKDPAEKRIKEVLETIFNDTKAQNDNVALQRIVRFLETIATQNDAVRDYVQQIKNTNDRKLQMDLIYEALMSNELISLCAKALKHHDKMTDEQKNSGGTNRKFNENVKSRLGQGVYNDWAYIIIQALDLLLSSFNKSMLALGKNASPEKKALYEHLFGDGQENERESQGEKVRFLPSAPAPAAKA